MGGGGNATGLGEGDPTLKNYLPAASDLPPGYAPFGEFTFRTPDGVLKTGGIDIAASMAFSGDITSRDPSGVGILMTMAMKPDDLQSLGDAFNQFKNLTQRDLEDALKQGTGDTQGFALKDVRVLDASGLGDGAAGFQMTIDLSALSNAFGGQTGVAGAPKLSSMTMRMYMFARGDYAGAVIRMGFADDLANNVDELALARVIDRKLKAAP